MRLANSMGKLMFFILVCHLALLISILPVRAEDAIAAKGEAGEAKLIETSSSEDEPVGALGIARHYAKRYNGRRTSSGAIYDPRKLTAAHPTLPLGTQVKVVNLANNRSVIVTVNDRCRKHGTAFIDLSRQAAQQLNFIHKSKANVRIIPLKKGNLSPVESAELKKETKSFQLLSE
jgi:rare lipoprotein A